VTYTPTAVGTGHHTITAAYAGDTNNTPSSGSSIVDVTLTSSQTSVSLNPSSVMVGGISQVSVTVAGISPTGTVTFTANPASSGSFNANSCNLVAGTCSVSFTSSAMGQISITGSYSGDTNNKPSSANAVLNIALLQTQKSTLAQSIKGLETGITNTNTIKNLDRAALHVQKSAGNELWNPDMTTLDLKHGNKVFNQEADAVNVLLNLIGVTTSLDSDEHDSGDDDTQDQDQNSLTTPALPSSTITAINGMINQLETVDKTLTSSQIAAASAHLAYLQSHGATAAKIQKVQQDITSANAALANAQSDLAAGKLHRAIYDYRLAWSFATDGVQIN
jgi:hypothetical protein